MVGRTKDFLVRDTLQSEFAHRFPGGAEIHDFAHAGHTGANHFDATETGGGQHFIAGELLVLRASEFRNPFGEGKVVEKAAHDCEFAMSVRVDEAGNDGAAGKFHEIVTLTRRASRVGLSRRERRDLAVFYSEGSIANRSGRSRTDPIRLIDGHAVKTCDRTVRRSIRSSLTV